MNHNYQVLIHVFAEGEVPIHYKFNLYLKDGENILNSIRSRVNDTFGTPKYKIISIDETYYHNTWNYLPNIEISGTYP